MGHSLSSDALSVLLGGLEAPQLELQVGHFPLCSEHGEPRIKQDSDRTQGVFSSSWKAWGEAKRVPEGMTESQTASLPPQFLVECDRPIEGLDSHWPLEGSIESGLQRGSWLGLCPLSPCAASSWRRGYPCGTTLGRDNLFNNSEKYALLQRGTIM